MFDELPSIDIAIPEASKNFLDAIEGLANNTSFNAERILDQFGNEQFDILNLWSTLQHIHTGLGVQLIARSKLKGRIAVEVRASRWSPNPPTFDVYCEAARDLLSPILKTFNKQTGSRLRLRIPTKSQLTPKLSPASSKLFERFIRMANKSALHPLDWRRFYAFVHGSRMYPLHESDMTRLLESRGFSSCYASEIASIYKHLCEYKYSVK